MYLLRVASFAMGNRCPATMLQFAVSICCFPISPNPCHNSIPRLPHWLQGYFYCELFSTVLCVGVIVVYGALTFRYRNVGAISVRGTLYLVYLYTSALLYCVSTAWQSGYFYGIIEPLTIAENGNIARM